MLPEPQVTHANRTRWASVSASRRTLPSSFSRHPSPLCTGACKCCGQACQKQPCTNTAVRHFTNGTSARRLRMPGPVSQPGTGSPARAAPVSGPTRARCPGCVVPASAGGPWRPWPQARPNGVLRPSYGRQLIRCGTRYRPKESDSARRPRPPQGIGSSPTPTLHTTRHVRGHATNARSGAQVSPSGVCHSVVAMDAL